MKWLENITKDHNTYVQYYLDTRQMLGALWGEPECTYEVNKIYWNLHGI